MDVPRLLQKTRSGDRWVTYTNRLGRYSVLQRPNRVRCLSDQTASLHVSDVLPWTGRRLLRAATRSWNFQWVCDAELCQTPLVSVLIPFRGTDRLPLLEATIFSLAAMNVPLEIIVIEQDTLSRIDRLPSFVRYVHAPHPSGDSRWHKCFAYNRGAEAAKGKILVLHDGDIVVPRQYGEVIRQHLVDERHEVLYPGRFLFYLDQRCTNDVLNSGSYRPAIESRPEQIKENWTGGTVAIRREAFESIGGYDEGFTGWTGEDREFYDRCQVLDGVFHSYLPFLHLWHPAQAGRVDSRLRREADEFTRNKLSVDRNDRIRALLESQRLNQTQGAGR